MLSTGEIKGRRRRRHRTCDATIDPVLLLLLDRLSKIDLVHHVKLWTVKKLQEHCIFSHYMAVHQL